MPPNELKYRVHLVDEGTVVARGERIRVWFLPFRDGWIRAKSHPDAELEEALAERRDARCPPGTIWRRSIELMLPPRWPLLSRVTSPLLEDLRTVDYLTKERRGMRRHVEETWFTVVGNYRLKKSKEPLAFARERKARRDDAAPR